MNLFSKLGTIVTGSVLSLGFIQVNSAQAVVFNFEWEGNNGYSANGSFSYDENTAPETFSEDGIGQTNVLESLNVSFFDSSDTLLGSFDSVVDGISTYSFFSFNFNTKTQELFDFLDVGEDTYTSNPSEFYLVGLVGFDLNLINLENGLTDNNSGVITVTPQAEPTSLPEPASMLGLLAVTGVGGASFKDKLAKAKELEKA